MSSVRKKPQNTPSNNTFDFQFACSTLFYQQTRQESSFSPRICWCHQDDSWAAARIHDVLTKHSGRGGDTRPLQLISAWSGRLWSVLVVSLSLSPNPGAWLRQAVVPLTAADVQSCDMITNTVTCGVLVRGDVRLTCPSRTHGFNPLAETERPLVLVRWPSA